MAYMIFIYVEKPYNKVYASINNFIHYPNKNKKNLKSLTANFPISSYLLVSEKPSGLRLA